MCTIFLQVAGSTSVFELHGNAATSTCMACREQMPTPEAIWQLQGQVSVHVPPFLTRRISETMSYLTAQH